MKGWFFDEKYSTLLYVELFSLRINVLLSGSVLAMVVSSTGTVGMGSKQAFEAFVQVLSSFLDFKKDGWQRFLVAITPPGGIGRYCIIHNLYLPLQIRLVPGFTETIISTFQQVTTTQNNRESSCTRHLYFFPL